MVVPGLGDEMHYCPDPPPFQYTDPLTGPFLWPEPADVPIMVESGTCSSFLCNPHGRWFSTEGR